MSKRFPTPEEEAEQRAQAEAMLRAIQAQRDREESQRQWLRERIEAGYEARENEERDREEERG
jgi:hypothetical protein